MIRGALILGVGFALGYSKAVYDTPEVKIFVAKLWEDIKVSAEVVSKTEPPSSEPTVTPIPYNPTEGESHG